MAFLTSVACASVRASVACANPACASLRVLIQCGVCESSVACGVANPVWLC